MNRQGKVIYNDDMSSMEDAITDFCRLFDTWIMNQDETVKFSSALVFGEEYLKLREMAVAEPTNTEPVTVNRPKAV